MSICRADDAIFSSFIAPSVTINKLFIVVIFLLISASIYCYLFAYFFITENCFLDFKLSARFLPYLHIQNVINFLIRDGDIDAIKTLVDCGGAKEAARRQASQEEVVARARARAFFFFKQINKF